VEPEPWPPTVTPHHLPHTPPPHLPTHSVCQTKWGQDPNGPMMAGKTYAELLAVAQDYYAAHPDEKPPRSYRHFQRHARLSAAAVAPDGAALAEAAAAAAAREAAPAGAAAGAPASGEAASDDPPLGPP
jgi:hypothetical protein